METLTASLVGFAGWLLRTSWQASVLIGLVLLAQWVFQKQLPPRWRYGLWLLVLIRLLLPVAPATPFSIFNYANRTSLLAPNTAAIPASPTESLASTASPAVPPAPSANTQAAPTAGALSQPNPLGISSGSFGDEHGSSPARRWPWPLVLSLLWLGGALVLAVRILRFPFRLNAQLAQHETAAGPAVFEVLEQAKGLAGMRKVLPVVQSRAVKSPALMGFIRPWLLLPHGLVEGLTPQELRFVFLHELAHLKRRDIAVNWLMTVLQVLHWFNPLVWFAFSRMRADRELACDELALSFARAEENKSYGQAIIKLLEGFTRPAVVPGLVGILENKQHMKRRINMIALFKQTKQWPIVAGVLIVALGLLTLTDAQTETGGLAQPTGANEAGGSPIVTKTLLTGNSPDAAGVLSPDETEVAFVDWDRSPSAPVVIKNLKTGQVRDLTKEEAARKEEYSFAAAPVWSPDAKWVAYCWFVDSVRPDLRITPVTNGSSRVLKAYSPKAGYLPQDWSPDGKWLLCMVSTLGMVGSMEGKADAALAAVAVETGQEQELASFSGSRPDHARYSPDGQWVVYEYTKVGNRDIYLLEVATRQITRLTDSRAEEGSPMWSRDGHHVLFSSNRRGEWDLLEMTVERGRPVSELRLLKAGFGNYPKRLTQKGNIAFNVEINNWDIYSLELNPATGEATGKPVCLSKSFFGQHRSPAWSPDGKSIAYSRRGVVCIQSLADGREECIDAGMGGINRIFWSPDSKALALVAIRKEGGMGIFSFSLSSRQNRPIWLNTNRSEFNGEGFSPDGKEFILRRTADDKGKEHVAVNIETGKERRLPPPKALRPVNYVNYAFSREDARIVHIEAVTNSVTQSQEWQLGISDRNLQGNQVLARAKDMFRPSCSPDGTKVAYLRNGDPVKGYELCITATDGRWQTQINVGRLIVVGLPLEWSPDSLKLALTLVDDRSGEIGLLENILPKGKVAAK